MLRHFLAGGVWLTRGDTPKKIILPKPKHWSNRSPLKPVPTLMGSALAQRLCRVLALC